MDVFLLTIICAGMVAGILWSINADRRDRQAQTGDDK